MKILPSFSTRKCFLTAVLVVLALADLAVAQQRPNIVFMLSDDQNWNGLSVAMHPTVAGSKGTVFNTPSLVKLASQGMRFSAAYAPAPVCSPTRISLQTGKSPAQMHWTKAGPSMSAAAGYKMIPPRLTKSLAREETTIAELLRSAGYATAHYGKWHLDGGGPANHGYDEHDGNIGNEYAGRFGDPNPVDIFGMVRRASSFMEKNKQAGKPFFIQLSWHALHSPQNALKTTLKKYDHLVQGNNYRRADVAAMTEDLDTGVGRIVQAVDRLGLADNTYVIYMSDNGGGNRRGPLNGGKGSVWEGGIRVPLIIRGPGVTANSWCHTRVVGFDFFPTFCEWAGISASKLPEGVEGGSIVSLLANPKQPQVKRPREELVFHFPHYQTGDGPHSALMLGNLKLMKFYEDNRLALFDLSKDIGEQNDLSGRMPQQTAQLHQRLNRYLAAVGAQLPVVNPSYDPSRPPTLPQKGRRGQGNRPGRPRRQP
jgi:arylsulfatase A-like enzyme